jgi:hypothetical protein
MILCKACAQTQMHLAGRADDASLDAVVGLATAHDAVPLLADVLRKVLAGQCMNRVQARSTLAWYLLGWQLLGKLEHEPHPEVELAEAILRDRSGLEGDGREISRQQHISRELS